MAQRKLAEIIKEVTEWQNKTFTQATPLSAATHLQREVVELIFAIQAKYYQGQESIRFEIVDCFLLLIAVAHLSGVDLEEAVEEKMAINKERTWGKPDADGVVEHVREIKGKTLLETFADRHLLTDQENIILKILKEEDNGPLQVD